MWLSIFILLLVWRSQLIVIQANTGIVTDNNNVIESTIEIGKCCDLDEILIDNTCTPLSETNETATWRPEFVDDKSPNASRKQPIKYQLRIGLPNCHNNEHPWDVYYDAHGQDRLAILTTGKLRHFVHDKWGAVKGEKLVGHSFSMNYPNDDDDDDNEDDVSVEPLHVDYSFGHYCADKVVLRKDRIVTTYAKICVPQIVQTETNYLIRHVVDPITRAIVIVSYLVVAIVYFVLPQLRDLVGNMITSMALCLVTYQIAVTVRIFTENASHISFPIADTVAYVSLLAAFFWLNALGYFVWNTFRSRNVFLRVTDGRKYCYYSTYAWGSTATIAGTAIFAHFTLDGNNSETVSWLGMSVIFTTIAITVIVDLCFVFTTASTIKRMRTYGRIHHKMKYSFRMFTLIFGLMTIGWLSLMISLTKFDYVVYSNIIVNFLQAVIILYVCVFGQKRVTFLLSKTCNCCNSENDNVDDFDWGEEMTAINAGY